MHKAEVLAFLHQNYSQAVVHHMDGIFIAPGNNSSFDATLKATITAIQQAGLITAEEKIQQISP